LENTLQIIAVSCSDITAEEARVRLEIGPTGEATVSRDSAILPLADALIRAKSRDGSGADQAAGNAVEGHIDAMAARMSVAMGTATGIMSKPEKFASPAYINVQTWHSSFGKTGVKRNTFRRHTTNKKVRY
jgi:hypothetical protein